MQSKVGSTHGDVHDASSVLESVDSLEEITDIDVEDGTDRTDRRLSEDEVFEVLYNSLRRDVITYLREHENEATVSDIAEHIAAKENDKTVQQLSSYERKRVYIGLYQNHLPMMDDVGVIEYDKHRGTVQLRECATQLEPYLGDVDRSDRSAIVLGGTLTLAGVLLFGILDVGAVGLVPESLLITFSAIGLVGLTALDAYKDSFSTATSGLSDRLTHAVRRVRGLRK